MKKFGGKNFRKEDFILKDLNEYHVSRVREQQKKLEKAPKTNNKPKQDNQKIRWSNEKDESKQRGDRPIHKRSVQHEQTGK